MHEDRVRIAGSRERAFWRKPHDPLLLVCSVLLIPVRQAAVVVPARAAAARAHSSQKGTPEAAASFKTAA